MFCTRVLIFIKMVKTFEFYGIFHSINDAAFTENPFRVLYVYSSSFSSLIWFRTCLSHSCSEFYFQSFEEGGLFLIAFTSLSWRRVAFL